MMGVGKGTISKRNAKEFNYVHTRGMRKGIKGIRLNFQESLSRFYV
jgi:hypothetical protein